MHKSQSLFYLTTALHVSGVIITHLQEYNCAPEDGWWWRPKHVEQLSDKINSVTCAPSCNNILEYYYDARIHKH